MFTVLALLGTTVLLDTANAGFTATATNNGNSFAAAAQFCPCVDFVDASTVQWTGGDDRIVTVPNGVAADDLLLAFVGGQNETIGVPSGWLTYQSAWDSVEAVFSAILYRVADGTEGGSNVTFGNLGSYAGGAAILVYRGVDPVTPFDAYASSAYKAATAVGPSITTTVDDTQTIVFIWHENPGTFTEAAPAQMTERVDSQSANRTLLVADEYRPDPGATGTRTFDHNSSDDGRVHHFALRHS